VAQQNKAPEVVFTYMHAWLSKCLATGNFTDSCSVGAFEAQALPLWTAEALTKANATRGGVLQAVQQCVANATADVDGDAPIAFLSADAALSSAIAPEPTITVNSKPVRGAFTGQNALLAACSAFLPAEAPAECAKMRGDPCAPGGKGELACSSGLNAAAGRSLCVSTVAGGSFRCECAPGACALLCCTLPWCSLRLHVPLAPSMLQECSIMMWGMLPRCGRTAGPLILHSQDITSP
jgi:hypothetical protein